MGPTRVWLVVLAALLVAILIVERWTAPESQSSESGASHIAGSSVPASEIGEELVRESASNVAPRVSVDSAQLSAEASPLDDAAEPEDPAARRSVRVAGAGDFEFDRQCVFDYNPYGLDAFKDPKRLARAIAFLRHPNPLTDESELEDLGSVSRAFLHSLAVTPRNARFLVDLLAEGPYWRDSIGDELGEGFPWTPEGEMTREAIDDTIAGLLVLANSSENVATLEGVARALRGLGYPAFPDDEPASRRITEENLARYKVIPAMLSMLDRVHRTLLERPWWAHEDRMNEPFYPGWPGSALGAMFRTLGEFKTPEAVEALIELTKSDAPSEGDPDLRTYAIEQLGNSGSPLVRDYLAEKIRATEDHDIRLEGAKALALMQDSRGVETIRAWAAEHPATSQNRDALRTSAMFLAGEADRSGLDLVAELWQKRMLGPYEVDQLFSRHTGLPSKLERDYRKPADDLAAESWYDWWIENRNRVRVTSGR